MFLTLRTKIRSIATGLSNIWKWRKVIYNDRNWDYWFIYQILKTKLEFQADHFAKNGYHESAGEDIKEIRECIELIDKVQNEYYLDELFKQDKFSLDEANLAEEKHNSARKQLFSRLEKNIEGWWD